MRAVARLFGPDLSGVCGSTLIIVGMLLLLYAAGMYADVLPGSRVSVPPPAALERRRDAGLSSPDIEPVRVVVPIPVEVRAAPADDPPRSDALPIPGLDAPADTGPSDSVVAHAAMAPAAADAANETASSAETVPMNALGAAAPPIAAEPTDSAIAVATVEHHAEAVDPQVATEPASSPPQVATEAASTAPNDLAEAPGMAPPSGQAINLSIPNIDLATEVVRAGLITNADGEPEWETVPFLAAHYVETALVGAIGNAVIAGHVITRNEGNVFRNLYLIDFGDEITTQTADASFRYVVRDIELVPPSAVEVMSPTPDATLTLITCGGEFNPRTRQFSHRLVVTAKLVAAQGRGQS